MITDEFGGDLGTQTVDDPHVAIWISTEPIVRDDGALGARIRYRLGHTLGDAFNGHDVDGTLLGVAAAVLRRRGEPILGDLVDEQADSCYLASADLDRLTGGGL